MQHTRGWKLVGVPWLALASAWLASCTGEVTVMVGPFDAMVEGGDVAQGPIKDAMVEGGDAHQEREDASGQRPLGARCDPDGGKDGCQGGLVCVKNSDAGSVCAHACNNPGRKDGCTGDYATCLPLSSESGGPMNSTGFCAHGCRPWVVNDCGEGAACKLINPVNKTELYSSECVARNGTIGEGDKCEEDDDCARTLYCYNSKCRQACKPGETQCQKGGCKHAYKLGNVTVGYCVRLKAASPATLPPPNL